MKPVTVNVGDDEKDQAIAALTGALEQQTAYKEHAVRECMRLRAIIAKCETCRHAANAPFERQEN